MEENNLSFTPFDFKKRQEEIIESIFLFVYKYMSNWRDAPTRAKAEDEKLLNSSFSKYLSISARNCEFTYSFSHEESQGSKRTVDISVYFNNTDCFEKVITVFECKRLSDKIEKKRKDEYVTGHKDVSGGIQRFRLEKHGKDHKIVGMIGYVQTGTCLEWQKTVNSCIEKLCGEPDENGLLWNKEEYLNLTEHDEKNDKSFCKSLHQRITKENITIYHLWVNMLK
jgi:hypothetical protein